MDALKYERCCMSLTAFPNEVLPYLPRLTHSYILNLCSILVAVGTQLLKACLCASLMPVSQLKISLYTYQFNP